MDATFFGILATQIQTLKETDKTNRKEANEILMKTVKLLLDNIDYSGDTLCCYDKIGMRKMFSSFSNVAQTACDFYEKAKPYLDPVALSGELAQRLERASEKIGETTALFQTIENENSAILEKEQELNEISTAHFKLEEKITKLLEIEKTITPDKTEALQAQINRLEEELETAQNNNNNLEQILAEYKETLTSLENSFIRENEEKTMIEENITEIINARQDTLRKIYTQKEKNLDSIKSRLIKYLQKYADFENEVTKFHNTYNFYKMHFEENGKINQKLREQGITSGVNNELAELESSVGSELIRYDGMIKVLLAEQKALKDEILRLQNK